MKWDERFFNSLETGGGRTSVTWVGSSKDVGMKFSAALDSEELLVGVQ